MFTYNFFKKTFLSISFPFCTGLCCEKELFVWFDDACAFVSVKSKNNQTFWFDLCSRHLFSPIIVSLQNHSVTSQAQSVDQWLNCFEAHWHFSFFWDMMSYRLLACHLFNSLCPVNMLFLDSKWQAALCCLLQKSLRRTLLTFWIRRDVWNTWQLFVMPSGSR